MTATLETGSDQEFVELLEQARGGDPNALGELLDRCVPYLKKIAHDEADDSLKAKLGASDLVQFACMDAVRGFKKFRGRTSKEMLGWLRRILIHRVHGARDEFHADKRDITAEISLQLETDDSKNDNLHAPIASPSDLIVRKEEHEVLELRASRNWRPRNARSSRCGKKRDWRLPRSHGNCA